MSPNPSTNTPRECDETELNQDAYLRRSSLGVEGKARPRQRTTGSVASSHDSKLVAGRSIYMPIQGQIP